MSDDEPNPSRRTGLLLAAALAVYVADQVTKWLVVARIDPGKVVRIVGDVVVLRLVRNPGAAFGLAAGGTAVFAVVAAAVAVVILRGARRLRSTAWALALGMVLGGAVGNLTDRVLRSPAPLRGHVVDFIELPHWPVFNVADMAIVVGGLATVLLTLRGRRPDGTKG